MVQCPQCTFENSELLNECEMCSFLLHPVAHPLVDTNLSAASDNHNKDSETARDLIYPISLDAGIEMDAEVGSVSCPACSFLNKPTFLQCAVCNSVLVLNAQQTGQVSTTSITSRNHSTPSKRAANPSPSKKGGTEGTAGAGGGGGGGDMEWGGDTGDLQGALNAIAQRYVIALYLSCLLCGVDMGGLWAVGCGPDTIPPFGVLPRALLTRTDVTPPPLFAVRVCYKAAQEELTAE